MRLTVASAFAALSLPLVAAGCAPTPGDQDAGIRHEPRACFLASNVTNFRAGDDQKLYLRAGLRDGVYELEALGFCRDLDFAQAIAISSEAGGGNTLCPGDRVALAYRGGGAAPTGPCRATVIRKLTDAEVAALPSRSRP